MEEKLKQKPKEEVVKKKKKVTESSIVSIRFAGLLGVILLGIIFVFVYNHITEFNQCKVMENNTRFQNATLQSRIMYLIEEDKKKQKLVEKYANESVNKERELADLRDKAEIDVSQFLEKDFVGRLKNSKGELTRDYLNQKLGIYFKIYYYTGPEYRVVAKDNVLQIVGYPEEGKEEPVETDYLEIYKKSPNESFEQAVKRIVSSKGASEIGNCIAHVSEEHGMKKLRWRHNERFEWMEDFRKNPDKYCLPDEESFTCSHRKYDEMSKIYAKKCSDFEGGRHDSYFIYQPESTKNKIAFIRHIWGLDGAPWEIPTIKLFD